MARTLIALAVSLGLGLVACAQTVEEETPATQGALGKAFTTGEIVFTAGVSPESGPRSSRRSPPANASASARPISASLP